MRTELQRHRLGDLADQQRLRQPWHAHQQRMAASKHADRQLLDDTFLANDDSTQLVFQPRVNLTQVINRLDVVVAEFIGSSSRGFSYRSL